MKKPTYKTKYGHSNYYKQFHTSRGASPKIFDKIKINRAYYGISRDFTRFTRQGFNNRLDRKKLERFKA